MGWMGRALLLLIVLVLAACRQGDLSLPGSDPSADRSPLADAVDSLVPTAEATTDASLDAGAGAEFEQTPPPSDGTNDQAVVDDAQAQQQTLMDIRKVDPVLQTMMADWFAGSRPTAVSAGSTDSKIFDLSKFYQIAYERIARHIRPNDTFFYMNDKLPENDGWGHRYEYYLNDREDPSQDGLPEYNYPMVAIRSAGRDGVFSGMTYTVGTFPPTEYDEDIVWTIDNDNLLGPEKGGFVRMPEQGSEPY